MIRALIGATGFIGQNLQSQLSFNQFFNSKNIRELKARRYDEIYCCAAPGLKWFANQNPNLDWASISNLMEHLRTIECRKVILVSTVDVYGDVSSGCAEHDSVKQNRQSPYGKHRWELEQFIQSKFDYLIVRLPLLFGHGLKKNVLFDLINRERLDKINPGDTHQWYPLNRLASDIDKALVNRIPLINLVSEPVPLREIIVEFFDPLMGKKEAESQVFYDVKSNYSSIFRGEKDYILTKKKIFDELGSFLSAKGVFGGHRDFGKEQGSPVEKPDLNYSN